MALESVGLIVFLFLHQSPWSHPSAHVLYSDFCEPTAVLKGIDTAVSLWNSVKL